MNSGGKGKEMRKMNMNLEEGVVGDGIVGQFRIAALALAHVDVDLFGLDDPVELGHVAQIDGEGARAATLRLPASGGRAVVPPPGLLLRLSPVLAPHIPQSREIVAEVVVLPVLFLLPHLPRLARRKGARRADAGRPVLELHPPAQLPLPQLMALLTPAEDGDADFTIRAAGSAGCAAPSSLTPACPPADDVPHFWSCKKWPINLNSFPCEMKQPSASLLLGFLLHPHQTGMKCNGINYLIVIREMC